MPANVDRDEDLNTSEDLADSKVKVERLMDISESGSSELLSGDSFIQNLSSDQADLQVEHENSDDGFGQDCNGR